MTRNYNQRADPTPSGLRTVAGIPLFNFSLLSNPGPLVPWWPLVFGFFRSNVFCCLLICVFRFITKQLSSVLHVMLLIRHCQYVHVINPSPSTLCSLSLNNCLALLFQQCCPAQIRGPDPSPLRFAPSSKTSRVVISLVQRRARPTKVRAAYTTKSTN